MATSSAKKRAEQPIELSQKHMEDWCDLRYWKDGAGTVWLESNCVLKYLYKSLIPVDPLKRVQVENKRLFTCQMRGQRLEERKKLLLNQAGVWQLLDESHLSRLNKTKALRTLARFYRGLGVVTVDPDCIHYTQGQCPWQCPFGTDF